MLAKIFLPLLFKKAVGKMQDNMNQQNGQRETYTKPPGTISVDYVPPTTTKKQTKVSGNDDFIPFEEVK